MSEDFFTLSDTWWFSNKLVEYILQILLQQSKHVEGFCIGANLLFLEPCKTKFYKQFRKNYVLFPLLDDMHFVLFILDLKEKIICYIDPKGETQVDFKRYAANFELFLNEYNSKFNSIGDISQWKIKKMEHCIQNDSVNCGPYVVRYCELFITKGEIHFEEFDPYRYRIHLKKMILTTSEKSMVDFCLRCGQHSNQTKREITWIECGNCERWLYSTDCARVNIADYPKGVPYNCPLCLKILA